MPSIKELLKYASINDEGGVLLGDNVVVDGPCNSRAFRVVTHAHSDHLLGLNKSIQTSRYIVTTPITYDIMRALGLVRRRYIDKYIQVEYGKRIAVGDDEILVFYQSDHIPGASQVLVEKPNIRVGYTGDFKNPGKGTPILYDLDVLVIEATYGKPEWTRPFKDEVEELFVDLIKDLLARGPVHIQGFHGKIQEAMLILRSHGIDTPFITTPTVYKVTRALERHGYWFGKVYNSISLEAKEAMRDGWYIFFSHTSSHSIRNNNNNLPTTASRVILTGWEFNEPYRRLRNNTWIVALSDHADFEQLLYYVEEAKPKLLIVDNYRQGAGEIFAHEVRKRLGVPAISQPSKYIEILA